VAGVVIGALLGAVGSYRAIRMRARAKRAVDPGLDPEPGLFKGVCPGQFERRPGLGGPRPHERPPCTARPEGATPGGREARRPPERPAGIGAGLASLSAFASQMSGMSAMSNPLFMDSVTSGDFTSH